MRVQTLSKIVCLTFTLATSASALADALTTPDTSPADCFPTRAYGTSSADSPRSTLSYISTFPPEAVQDSVSATKGCEVSIASVSPNSLTGGWKYDIESYGTIEIRPYISCFDVGTLETLCYGSPSSDSLNLSYSWSISGDLQHNDYAPYGLPRMAGIACIPGGNGGVLTLLITNNESGDTIEASRSFECSAAL